MKKIFILCIFAIMLVGCAKEENKLVEPAVTPTFIPTSTPTNIPTTVPTVIGTIEPTIAIEENLIVEPIDTDIFNETEIPIQEPILDNNVDIIFTWANVNDEETINEYVNGLNSQGDAVYKVYDEEHYMITIKESQRLEDLSYLLTENCKDEMFSQLNEQYPGVYNNIEVNEKFTEIIFNADIEKYNDSDFGAALTPIFISFFYMDYIQAYSLIPVDERHYDIKIIDSKTNEIIYSTE